MSVKKRAILPSLAVGLAIQPGLTGVQITILQHERITVFMEADGVCREVSIEN
ncbi:MAG: hypothetical protein GY799_15815 [Desulfobulbaceae bacterium]|nr:hypothetical protein [Desulfobulbaceae bacterium]